MQKYQVLACVDSSPEMAEKVLNKASRLLSNMQPDSFTFTILHIVALNPPSSLPYMDQLEGDHNVEIKDLSSTLPSRVSQIMQAHPALPYDFQVFEKVGSAGPLLVEYVQSKARTIDLIICGSKKSWLEKIAVGGFSEYCQAHLKEKALLIVQ